MKKCPFCAEDIQDAAVKCRHCGSLLDGSVVATTSTAKAAAAGRTKAEPERTVYETGLHWVVFLRPTIWLFLALVFLVAPGLSAFFFLLALADFAGRWMMRSNTQFKLISQRLTLSTGTFRKRSLELVLSKVESLTVDEPMLGRMLGYGTVIVGGTGGTKEAFPRVSLPQELRSHVQQQLAIVPSR